MCLPALLARPNVAGTEVGLRGIFRIWLYIGGDIIPKLISEPGAVPDLFNTSIIYVNGEQRNPGDPVEISKGRRVNWPN